MLRLRVNNLLKVKPIITSHPIRNFSSTNKRLAEIQLEVDGVKVSIEQGSSLIQACEKAGKYFSFLSLL